MNSLALMLMGANSLMAMPFPSFPDDFSSVIEANILNKNYTLQMREFYDYSNDQFRIESHRQGRSTIDLCFLGSQKQHVQVVNTNGKFNCTVEPLAAGRTCRFASRAPHLQKASDFLSGHIDPSKYSYTGQQVERGIPCDKWTAVTAFNRTMRNTTYESLYTLEWYFAQEQWRVRGFDAATSNYSMPVALYLTGESSVGGKSHNFSHVYNFIDFIPSFDDVSHYFPMFAIDPRWKCPAAAPTAPAAPTAAAPTTDSTSGFHVLEAHKTAVAVLPAVGLVLAVKLFM